MGDGGDDSGNRSGNPAHDRGLQNDAPEDIEAVLKTSLGSYWHIFMDIYSDENGVQFAQSMIYNYQQELWKNNWGHCPEMDACQTEIRHSEVDTPMQYEKK